MAKPDLDYFRRSSDPTRPVSVHSVLEPLSARQAAGLILVGFLVGLLVAFSIVWWYIAVRRR